MTRTLRLVLVVLFSIVVMAPAFSAGAERPNVIILITDDQGYGDLSCHGNPVLKTPHLDALHSESVRFTDFHVAPMCTPTRGQLMTGLDAARNGAINVSSGRTLLRAGLPTMADFFAENGYHTGIFGKWHLGDNYPFRPEDRGFQEALWFPSSHINSVPDHWDNDYFDDTYHRNGELKEYRGYCTDVFFDEAIAWMKARAGAGEPFFTYIPTNAPHGPHWVPDEYRTAMRAEFEEAVAAGKLPELNAKAPQGQRAGLISYLAMIRNIDDNVGKLETFLKEAGLAENTVFVYLTDNGSTFGHAYFTAGMRGKKTELWEGGHRVPCFVRWPAGGLGEPRDVDGLTQVQDLLPTLIDLCGLAPASPPKFDGVSLEPVLRGEAPVPPEERMLVVNYSRMPFPFTYPSPDATSRMTREGAGVLYQQWRLLQDRELYDLGADPKQQTNVIKEYPDIAAKMRARLDAWWSEVEAIANEPQPVIIGSEKEDPMTLTACEWLDVFVDQQRQIRRADRKNGFWELDVARPGQYEFELRRWPREADLALTAGLEATKVTDGVLAEGVALPIARARILVGGIHEIQPLKKESKAATFTVRLKAGPARLHTWFEDQDQNAICGAYYVYVRRRGD